MLSISPLSLLLPSLCGSQSPFNAAPLMKSVGSVIFSSVSWVSPLPNNSRSSQNSAGPTDRNSPPCRYQTPLLLTKILICLSLFVFTPKAPVCPAHFKKTRFRSDCFWQLNLQTDFCSFQLVYMTLENKTKKKLILCWLDQNRTFKTQHEILSLTEIIWNFSSQSWANTPR